MTPTLSYNGRRVDFVVGYAEKGSWNSEQMVIIDFGKNERLLVSPADLVIDVPSVNVAIAA